MSYTKCTVEKFSILLTKDLTQGSWKRSCISGASSGGRVGMAGLRSVGLDGLWWVMVVLAGMGGGTASGGRFAAACGLVEWFDLAV